MGRAFDEWNQEVFDGEEARQQGSLALWLATDDDGNIDGEALDNLQSHIPTRRATDDEYLYVALTIGGNEEDDEPAYTSSCMVLLVGLGGVLAGGAVAVGALVHWFA